MSQNEVTQYLENTVIQQYKTDIGFRTLVDSVNDNMYIIPKYQRKFRWDKERVIGLVESLLKGLPIPPIYTCRNKENQLEILDGQQRVMSLFFYYIGYFLNNKKNNAINFSELEVGKSSFKDALMEKYSMEELHINLVGENGKEINVDYATLPVEVKRKLDYTTITVIEIKIDQPGKHEEVLRTIFANLNKRGMLLSDQEQRNGIYNCEFYDMIQEFNKNNKKWRKIWGREDSKERDMEILVRLCALKKYVSVREENFVIDGYNSSYAEMLDRFSQESMKLERTEINEYKKSLEQFVELFHTKTTFSSKINLLDSLFILYEKKNLNFIITEELCKNISNSAAYKASLRQGTVKIKKINERWKAVDEILCQYD